MPLLLNKEVVTDNWTLIDADTADQTGDVIVPLALYVEQREQFDARDTGVALQLNGDDDLNSILSDIDRFPMIAIDFPAFRDGRGFSIARLLKRQGYRGQLRATGDIGRDQLDHLARCGFDALDLNDDKFSADAINAFAEVSVRYQGAADETKPVYLQ
ncbi:DUF934 domain-containing protein [Pontibacter sp. JAM-7]|uniref:DUF934 domain-containing protein n=1 Tax=Pontibacter sp. JAM-7 TaxID=3366581 RepID=UPI003AF9F1F7